MTDRIFQNFDSGQSSAMGLSPPAQ